MGCGDGKEQPSKDFRAAAYAQDGSRPVTGNMIGWVNVNPTAMSGLLDVMGFSHSNANNIANFHAKVPTQPVAATECCSCESQRGEDADQPHDATVFQSDEIQSCLLDETQRFNSQAFLAGQFIWTLHGAMRSQAGGAPVLSIAPRAQVVLSIQVALSPLDHAVQTTLASPTSGRSAYPAFYASTRRAKPEPFALADVHTHIHT